MNNKAGGVGNGAIRTAKCIIHEDTEVGTYYIHFGVRTFKYTKTSDRRNDGQLLFRLPDGNWKRQIYIPNGGSLEGVIKYIKNNFDSGITISPPQDRRVS